MARTGGLRHDERRHISATLLHKTGRFGVSFQTFIRISALLGVVAAVSAQPQSPQPDTAGSPRFKSGVELVNVTATVSDARGRFVSGLHQEDFVVYEDDAPQVISYFSAERVPVSLGIALDTSGSMAGEKMRSAQGALNRFLELLDGRDEMFLYRFSNDPVLVQGWTNDRQVFARALSGISPGGGTAMYDAVGRAVAVARTGQHQKKAIIVISDGNDTLSRIGLADLKQTIRESEVLVYAIGIDGETIHRDPPSRVAPRPPFPIPLPLPGGPRGRGRGPFFPSMQQPPIHGPAGGRWSRRTGDERVNVSALRDMTDDSGGRTEVIGDVRDLDPATTGIADELSKQYDLGYAPSRNKDGRWHSIRVEVPGQSYRIRARRGYIAS
jgi:VWFA-related protein